MNALALFLVRQIIRTYRTIQCLVAAALGALGSCIGVILYTNYDYFLFVVLLEAGVIILMNIISFGGKNLLWHLFLFSVSTTIIAGGFLYVITAFRVKVDVLSAIVVSLVAFAFCVLLEKKSRMRWKEEHMKAKTVLEFRDRKLFATALMDTGNKLYDPIFHKPVILVDEKIMNEMLTLCKEECPEKLHFIPFHSVGQENGLLAGMSFDYVSIKWQEKQLKFKDVIAAATKESLYKGKEYQVIFHCGLLQEG
jgi:stage II sporulation protein GA (sporulation sigma-E factor processing peptidase)